MSSQPAKLFVNAKIFTSKKGDDQLYGSLLVHGGKVLHVGQEDDATRVAKEVRVTRLATDRMTLG